MGNMVSFKIGIFLILVNFLAAQRPCEPWPRCLPARSMSMGSSMVGGSQDYHSMVGGSQDYQSGGHYCEPWPKCTYFNPHPCEPYPRCMNNLCKPWPKCMQSFWK